MLGPTLYCGSDSWVFPKPVAVWLPHC
ncbi:hypothetical protein [Yersinia kristensenii]